MAYQQAIFANEEFYHIFNRGVEKRATYVNHRDYQRFLQTLEYYRFKNPPAKFSARHRPHLNKKVKDESVWVEIVCFCLMPNHFHLVVKQIEDGGITKFISKSLNSYTKYFNTKHNRVGPLFQGAFKAKRIEDTEQLLHLSRYIHLNPLIDYLVEDLSTYTYSSYSEFIGNLNNGFCQTRYILDHFSKSSDYQRFVLDQEDYGRTIKYIERALILEEEEYSI
ncbi:transposase [Candidatus Daviesbacteria bacterium]|nr:transposase [Candidatus Daviesbacteria bacterium]